MFRAEVVGGDREGTFLARNDIPLCTIYGDNRIVWLNELGGRGGRGPVGQELQDQQIKDYVSYS